MLRLIKNSALSIVLIFFTSNAQCVTAYHYNCPDREKLTITRAQYRLNMIQWDNNFYVGIGDKKVRLEGNEYLYMIYFMNGERFYYDDNYTKALIIYGKSEKARPCILLSIEKIDALKLPVYR